MPTRSVCPWPPGQTSSGGYKKKHRNNVKNKQKKSIFAETRWVDLNLFSRGGTPTFTLYWSIYKNTVYIFSIKTSLRNCSPLGSGHDGVHHLNDPMQGRVGADGHVSAAEVVVDGANHTDDVELGVSLGRFLIDQT